MILSYNDYKSEKLYESRYHRALYDSKLRTKCVYCGHKLKREEKGIGILWGDPRDRSYNQKTSAVSAYNRRILLRCNFCGWWLVLWDTQEKEYPSETKRYIIEHYWAILNKYNINDLDVPISELRQHINKQPQDIWKLNYRQFGRLMTDCFSSYFDCDVEYLDGPHDKGVDAYLYLIQSKSSPYLVQYKARQGPRPSESVSVIREVLGAMVVNNVHNGIVVTTRKKWSYSAITTSSRTKLAEQGYYIELYNCKKVLNLISSRSSNDTPPWEFIFNPIILQPDFLKETIQEEKMRSKRYRKYNDEY